MADGGESRSPRQRAFPYLPITITVLQHTWTVEALLDTGFDGHVAIPAASLTNGQSPDGHLGWILADGSQVLAPYFLGTVTVGTIGPYLALVTTLGDEPLIGREVAAHFTITLDHGRQVIIEP